MVEAREVRAEVRHLKRPARGVRVGLKLRLTGFEGRQFLQHGLRMTDGGDRVHDASDPRDDRLLLGAKPSTLGVLPPPPYLCLGAIGRGEGLHHVGRHEALAKRGEDPIVEIMLPHRPVVGGGAAFLVVRAAEPPLLGSHRVVSAAEPAADQP